MLVRLCRVEGVVPVLCVVVAACSADAPDNRGARGENIVGGTVASAYPEAALVDLLRGGRLVAACSGSVIAPRVVLTAGHCVDGFDGWRITAPYASRQTSTASSAT